MAQSETSGSESLRDTSAPTPAAAGGAVTSTEAREARSTRRLPSSIVSAPERERLIKQARDTEFPVALRGYDRGAVDRYVEHVNRLLAELEISSSPESAVRHALDEVSEETRDILQHAHNTAEEITPARARAPTTGYSRPSRRPRSCARRPWRGSGDQGCRAARGRGDARGSAAREPAAACRRPA